MALPLHKKVACYTSMLTNLESTYQKAGSVGLCLVFIEAICSPYSFGTARNIEEGMLRDLPELQEYKPVTREFAPYWFDRKDVQVRKQILETILSKLIPKLTLWDKFRMRFLRDIQID